MNFNALYVIYLIIFYSAILSELVQSFVICRPKYKLFIGENTFMKCKLSIMILIYIYIFFSFYNFIFKLSYHAQEVMIYYNHKNDYRI